MYTVVLHASSRRRHEKNKLFICLGAAASSDYVTSVPCATTEVVNGSTYYHCSSTWYRRGYEGGEVVYIIVSPPAGR